MSLMIETITHGLEEVFRRIHRERMADLPFLHPGLQVEAVGFRHWEGNCIGILVTPWFMNIMRLPSEGDQWKELPVGSSVEHRFPAGTYRFTVGHEPGLGHYQACSLFSPMLEFEDQASAVATAKAAMEALMNSNAQMGAPSPTPPEAKAPVMERSMSRRTLLRGLLPGIGR